MIGIFVRYFFDFFIINRFFIFSGRAGTPDVAVLAGENGDRGVLVPAADSTHQHHPRRLVDARSRIGLRRIAHRNVALGSSGRFAYDGLESRKDQILESGASQGLLGSGKPFFLDFTFC